jgi:hypothetical protein
MFSPPLVGQSERAEKRLHQAERLKFLIFLIIDMVDQVLRGRYTERSIWGEGRKRRTSEEMRKE